MEMVQFESEFLAAAGHDENSRTLEIHFQNGSQYEYYNVPPDAYLNFIAAPSKGEFYNKHIKPAFRGYKIAGPHQEPRRNPGKPPKAPHPPGRHP